MISFLTNHSGEPFGGSDIRVSLVSWLKGRRMMKMILHISANFSISVDLHFYSFSQHALFKDLSILTTSSLISVLPFYYLINIRAKIRDYNQFDCAVFPTYKCSSICCSLYFIGVAVPSFKMMSRPSFLV